MYERMLLHQNMSQISDVSDEYLIIEVTLLCKSNVSVVTAFWPEFSEMIQCPFFSRALTLIAPRSHPVPRETC